MRKRTQIRWIEHAEARSFVENATRQRAASEPHVCIECAAIGSARLGRLRGLARPLARTIGAVRSLLINKTILLRARFSAAVRTSSAGGHDDRVRVAILITDIVGSTKLVVAMGDQDWRVLLDRHDDAIRRQIRLFGGKEVGNRGDGFVGIFDTAAHAVCCATAIADSMSSLGLSLRCGIHFGEVHLKDDKIRGLSAHVAARITATAGPGEVFVSKGVCDLVTGSDLVFEDRSVHQLRDLPEEIQLYAVRPIVRR